jgi:vanillate/3-O-methylgallate O-demethylase
MRQVKAVIGGKLTTSTFVDVNQYDDIVTYMNTNGGTLHIYDGDGWKAESMAWKDGVYLASNLSGPVAQVRYSGPQAQELLSRVSINNVYNWKLGASKHLVMTDESGLIANHGLAVRDSEDSFRTFACMPWAAFNSRELGLDVNIEVNPTFIHQIAGPYSFALLEKLLGGSVRELKFLGIIKIAFPGIPDEVELELSRIGMAGTLAYEIRGPLEHGPAVFDALYQAGRVFGITRTGWRTYTVNHTEAGYPQMAVNFTPTGPALMKGIRRVIEGPPPAVRPISGSVDPANLRARHRSPTEANWGWMAKFDHDFIGRAAVEKEVAAPRRKTVTLRWNPADIGEIFASQFRQGDEYKFIEFPCMVQPKQAGGHADLVTKGGKEVGVASAGVYSYYYRELLTHCVIDIDQAEDGNEVIVHWGDFGGKIKEVRAIVSRFPYQDLPANKDYDLSSAPTRPPSSS